MITKAKIIATLIISVVAFGSGFMVNGWYRDSIELTRKQALDEVKKTLETRESSIAKDVESQIRNIRRNQKAQIVEVPKIITQPQLINVCLSDDAINSINAAIAAGRLQQSSD